MIIGLVGTLGSGKGEVAKFFSEKGFTSFSLSYELREEAKKREIEMSRSSLQDLGNELREKEGIGALAKRVIKKAKELKAENIIVDAIRNPGEIEELKKHGQFFLVAVDAPKEIRFKRLQERSKEQETRPQTWEEFLKDDERDLGEQISSGQQTAKCISIADFKIINDSTPEKFEQLIAEIHKKVFF